VDGRRREVEDGGGEGPRATSLRAGAGRARALEVGDGPAVVVLAIPPLDAGAYLPLLETLRARFRAVALELEAPDPERAEARDAQLVGVADEAMRSLGLGRALVVGQGASGRIAVELAIARPGAVAGLVLAAPAVLARVGEVQVPVLLYRRGRMVEHPALFARALGAFTARLQLGAA
jgi:pimeloyl-ACP methyl ester carboxylesterase